ncbi:MAG: methylenetetrahydrofolate--tRNA-(uracil(54)-C(5))-methyltransferase (FADH(2)-oxidizing) TrmFO [Acidobacteria bacterium]|nr:methylenetetrahydrofolate--tRNA-(uracil(54)-C(5))-methyltransferase (FADH(2)-oxidizing) TrmFO [Candidatus Sulfomarinibacter sp. MAG AM1]
MRDRGILVVGGGLAGSEAAWQLAQSGLEVRLMEMRPRRSTPVHRTDLLSELVCSNSLRGDAPTNAVGVLKAEMEALGSLIIKTARRARVPAGGALAVDRRVFAEGITTAISGHPRITVQRLEVEELPDGPAILATGPLTSPALHRALDDCLGEKALSFFDAVAPIVAADSLDMQRLFRASRYSKGDGADYLNAALDRNAYEAFVDALLRAERVPFKGFESADSAYFEGCLPIEVMAERGRETLRYGPMKPVGLTDPTSGRRPWAVVQLRQDDLAAEHWNLVGFQTKLTHGEQKRIFRSIPGLAEARFVRLGMIHRNTFINAPLHLDDTLRLRLRPHLRLAGQITGVEGYVESAATGLIAARCLAAEQVGGVAFPPPPETALGGLVRHLTSSSPDSFQPSNITWGLMMRLPVTAGLRGRRDRRQRHAELAVELARRWGETLPGHWV